MKPYAQYKNSGAEWIGQVPAHWKVERIGNWFVARNDKVDSVSFPPLSVSMQGVVDQLAGVAKSQDVHNRKLVKKNDFVINSRSDRKGSSGIAPRDGSVSLINTVLEPAEVNLRWVEHLLKSHYFKEEFFRNGQGIHWDLWTTPWDQMKTILIPIPSISEQNFIAQYLDNKVEQLNALIAKVEEKIELLNEQRTSLINEFVTKGLDSTVAMKDSGVEWIGAIPSHWQVKRFKYLFEVQKGKAPSELTDTPSEDYLPYLTMEVLRGGEPVSFANKSGLITADKNSTGLLWDGANAGEVVKIDRAGVLSSTMALVSSSNPILNKAYSYYLLKSFENDVRHNTVGMGVPHVDSNHTKNCKLVVPPLNEQNQIAAHLDNRTQKIDALIAAETRRIALLTEYKESLVSSVVTGKIRITEKML